jgi:tripartite-type tricarboxylate transporter receptor subunit TctC
LSQRRQRYQQSLVRESAFARANFNSLLEHGETFGRATTTEQRKETQMRRRQVLKGGTLLAAWPAWVFGQSAYPSQPIKYIVPVAPGGGSDLIGRALAEQLAKVLGQPVVVENIGGGGGVIACQTTARSAPDGYTLMQGYVATHGTSPATRKVPYDPLKDFTPIGMIGSTPNVLVVNTNTSVMSVADLVAYLKKNPARLSYGSAGVGSLTHLTGELFKLQTDTFMVHIPYRGIAPATTDLLSGQTQVMFPGLTAALSFIKSGRLKALAVTGSRRHPALPDVPTMDESGLKGFDAQQWYGVVGPAGLPPAVVKHLNDAMATVLNQADFRQKLSAEAVDLTPMTPAAMSDFMGRDLQRWTQLATSRNIRLDS